jgi:hypothetical protein
MNAGHSRAHPFYQSGTGRCRRVFQLLHRFAELAALNAANSLFLLDTSQFTLANEPALAPDGAQYTALDNLFTEALEQLILGFILT